MHSIGLKSDGKKQKGKQMIFMDQDEWSALSTGDNRKQLYLRQKDLLDKFLERNAIAKADYDKSLGDLTRKMGMEQLLQSLSANKGD